MATYRLQLPRLLLESATNGKAVDTNQTASSYDNKNFDSNMVIVLLALVCALMCAVGINSCARCLLRCTQMYETEDEEIPRPSSTRHKNDVFREIPMVVYKSGLHTPATECPICLGEFAEGENVRILPRCNHGFHVQCIDRWLLVHSSCPTCRQQLPEAPASISRYNGPLANLLVIR